MIVLPCCHHVYSLKNIPVHTSNLSVCSVSMICVHLIKKISIMTIVINIYIHTRTRTHTLYYLWVILQNTNKGGNVNTKVITA